MELFVDIEKRCGDFLLRTKFRTEGEILAVLGASGCGKSLTLKCIAGIERPDRGIIRLGDRVFFDSEKHINLPARKRRVGYLFQDYALFPNMTVLQNILCGAGSREKALDFVRRFYLEGKEGLYPAQLSGGQRQRTALARMLAAAPEAILLDEPFSALDSYLKLKLERELVNVFEGFQGPVLFVSHDRNEVYRMTDRIAVMEEGQLVGLQTKKELFQRPGTLAAARLTGCRNLTELKVFGDGSLWAVDWGMPLKGAGNVSAAVKYAGFFAHDFEPASGPLEGNVLECRVIRVMEDTFFNTVLLSPAGCSTETERSVLTLEISKEKWEQIRDTKIFLKIPEDKLIFMER